MERRRPPLHFLVASALLVAPRLAAPGPIERPGAAAELSAKQARTVAGLRDRQEQDLALLAKICGELPDELWIERVALDSTSASVAGTSWTADGVAELMATLDHTPGFESPAMSAIRTAPDNSQHFRIALARVAGRAAADRAAAGGGESTPMVAGAGEIEGRALLRLVAPGGAVPELSDQIRSLLEGRDVTDFRLAPAGVTADPLELRSLSIRVARTRFAQVLDFLNELRRLPSLAVAENVEMDGRGGRLGEISATLRLTLPAWRQPS